MMERSKTCQACPYIDTCDHKCIYDIPINVIWPTNLENVISDILRLRDGWMKKGKKNDAEN